MDTRTAAEPAAQESSGLETTLLIIAIIVTVILIGIAAWVLFRVKKQKKRRQDAQRKKEFDRMVWEVPNVASTEATSVNEKTTVNDTIIMPGAGGSKVSVKKSVTKK